MEILSLNFIFFVFQLSLCIVPIALGIRLFVLSSEKREDRRKIISKKLLGDPTLITQNFFNIVLYFIASAFVIFGLIVITILFIL